MNRSPPIESLSDHPTSSAMSEFDSLSDSDWLDIHEDSSDNDNDSVASSQDHDYFHDGHSLHTRSRRSSMSIGSSREGDIEAWEGFVDDSGDEALGTYVPLIPDPSGRLPEGFIPEINADPAEDQRVKDALDQSLVGTLSASRASSTGTGISAAHGAPSVHSSIRDLRLSFPDPLTSSLDELHRSYSDVSPSETNFSAAAADHRAGEPEGDLPPTPAAPHHKAYYDEDLNSGMHIVLYGASSPIKWSFVQELVQKASNVSGHVVVNQLEFDHGPIQILRLRKNITQCATLLDTIMVHDRTEGNLTDSDVDFVDRPSLAIVYLPSASLPVLSSHTLYLPVIIPPTAAAPDLDDDDQVLRHAAEDDWDLLSVSSDKLLFLEHDLNVPVFDSEDIYQLESLHAYRALQAVINPPKKQSHKMVSRAVSEHLKAINGVTFFALVSLIVGFAINTAYRPSIPIPTRTVSIVESRNLWELIGPAVNRSTSSTSGSTALTVSSLKDFALAVIHPISTSLSLTPAPEVPSLTVGSPVLSRTADCRSCKPTTLTVTTPKASTDLILRQLPVTQSLSLMNPKQSVPAQMAPEASTSNRETASRAEPPSSAVSLRIASSLSEIVDSVKAVSRVVSNDIQELIDAVDDLMRAISMQTRKTVRHGKGKAREIRANLRETVEKRNLRAKNKAKELRKRGEAFLLEAGQKLVGRTRVARKRAKVFRQKLELSEAWIAYRKAQGKWVAKLKEKGNTGTSGKGCMKGGGGIRASRVRPCT